MDYGAMIRKLIALGDPGALADGFEMCRELEMSGSTQVLGGKKRDYGSTVFDDGNFRLAHELNGEVRAGANHLLRKGVAYSEMHDLYYRTHLFDAPYFFDSFCLYIEKDREVKKQFYLPRRKQLKVLADSIQDFEDGKLDILGISLPPGVGKALANDTPILTRNGWKNHGDLVVGDEVIGMDGEFKKVVAVHPKCMLDVLIEFTNGEKIQCHENHEWMVYDRPRHKDKIYIAETKRFEKRKLTSGGEQGHRGHRYSLQLPHRGYVVGEEKNLALDPYVLGVWLGDGANKNPRICCDIKDTDVVNRIIRRGYSPRWHTIQKNTGVWYFDFDIRKELQSFGMCHSRKTVPKRIPQEYLTASVHQRLDLLAGLIDTDGTLAGSKYSFSTAEESLRDSFCDLISTFGWRYCVMYYRPRISSSGVNGKRGHYRVSFTPDISIPCELERKRNKEPHQQRAIAFKSIKRVEPKEGNCITVEGDGMYLAGKTMIPTHNTTIAEFGLAWTSGRNPFLPNIIGSHNNSFLAGVYGEMLRIFDSIGEYKWGDVFPGLNVISTNAKDMMIGLGYTKADDMRFKTLQLSSIGSGNAGKIRAMNWLYVDDLVEGIEQALSRERMDKLWQTYYTDLQQRMLGDRAKQLVIGTRWSVADPLGRLEMLYEGDPRARFINLPVADDDGHSLFDYPFGLGYSDADIKRLRDTWDELSLNAIYYGRPVEREGLLYEEKELRTYFTLPDKDPDSILAICDTKEQGLDYCVCPVFYQYGTDFYLDTIICDNSKVEVLEERVAQLLVNRKVRMCRVESNRGGTIFAQNVEKRVKELGGMTSITTKWTQSNKETRIHASAGSAKSHILFLDKNADGYNKEYQTAMTQLCTYSLAGKNKHDDVPDALSLFVNWQMSDNTNIATLIKRRF